MERLSQRLLLGSLLLGAAGGIVPWTTFAQPTPDATAGAADSLRPSEQKFLTDEIDIGRTTAESARLAVSQATSTGVREFAEQLVGDFGQINTTLEALARRKALPVAPAPASYSDEYRRLAGESATTFDRAYIRQTAVLARHALRACETAVAEAKDPDVRDLAGNLLPTLRDHVNKITALEQSL